MVNKPHRIFLGENDRLYTWDGKDYLIRNVPPEGIIPEDTLGLLVRGLLEVMRFTGLATTSFDLIWQYIALSLPDMDDEPENGDHEVWCNLKRGAAAGPYREDIVKQIEDKLSDYPRTLCNGMHYGCDYDVKIITQTTQLGPTDPSESEGVCVRHYVPQGQEFDQHVLKIQKVIANHDRRGRVCFVRTPIEIEHDADGLRLYTRLQFGSPGALGWPR